MKQTNSRRNQPQWKFDRLATSHAIHITDRLWRWNSTRWDSALVNTKSRGRWWLYILHIIHLTIWDRGDHGYGRSVALASKIESAHCRGNPGRGNPVSLRACHPIVSASPRMAKRVEEWKYTEYNQCTIQEGFAAAKPPLEQIKLNQPSD